MYQEDLQAARPGESQHAATQQQYFDSYGTDVAVTRVMLEDAPRMAFYRHALRPERVCDRVVVDVGSGSGVLALHAARSGARKVIAIEASPMADALERNVARFLATQPDVTADVHVVRADAETVTLESLRRDKYLEAGETVDVVVSEWMGFYLLHECMLQSVLTFRDNVTPAGGAPPEMVPGRCRMWLAPVDLEPFFRAAFGDFWADVDGFDMSAIADLEREQHLARNPLVQQLPPECVLCEPQVVATLDVNTATVADLDTVQGTAAFDYRASRVAADVLRRRSDARLYGFAVWFDVNEMGADSIVDPATPQRPASSPGAHPGCCLTTGPRDAPTHWKQSVVLLPPEVRGELRLVDLRDDVMGVVLSMQCNRALRCYDLGVELFDPEEVAAEQGAAQARELGYDSA